MRDKVTRQCPQLEKEPKLIRTEVLQLTSLINTIPLDQTVSLRKSFLLLKCCFTSTETVGLLGTGAQDVHLNIHTVPELWEKELEVEVLLYVHKNRRLIRDGSPGRPPRLSHSS